MSPVDSLSARLEAERKHQEDWYAFAIAQNFFGREGFRQLIAHNLKALERSVPLRSSMRVLSLGCGLGDYEIPIARRVRHVVAVDLAETAIGHARGAAAAAGIDNVEFITAGLLDLDYPPGSYDLVYAMGLLHHVAPDDRATLLRGVHRWLAAEGSFYARDPSANGVLRLVGDALGLTRGQFHSPDEQPLDPAALARELEGAGFTGVQIEFTDSLGGPLPWLLRTSSPLFWKSVFAIDRLWTVLPGVRRLASQFSVTAKR